MAEVLRHDYLERDTLQEDELELQKTVKALQVSQESILERLSLLENITERLPVLPCEPPATKASVPSRFQPSENPAVRRKADRAVVRATNKADEESTTANSLRAKGPPGRDFAIRGVRDT
ncbi:hypothetical protein RvY_02713 [Ramazzottius varieornatus]|uniref:Uncharacterized protein n=1 Tax=Ramazzottius varieornatus TaxID=947166 RepID=A0A1D1UPF7_RAMVA|nr:hypothetical protein RvY_02713 [Ramazzottius varieornatus]